jgi:hypothetical protein
MNFRIKVNANFSQIKHQLFSAELRNVELVQLEVSGISRKKKVH